MGTLPKGGSDSSGEIHLQLPEKDGGSSSYLVDLGSPVSIGSSSASSSHHSSLRELEREIAEALQRRHSDSRRPWLFHPDVVPYYHTAMSLLCVLIMCATAPKYLAPDYPLPGYLVNGTMTYSSTVFYLDVIFAAMGLPLGSDLFIDVVSHFVASDGDTNDINKRLQLSAKAKEWTLRFQFIVAFSLTSVARLACGIKDPARLVVLMYLTQFLRTVIICVYGMFSYTNTFDAEPWQYLRSLAVSAMFIVSHMLIYYGRYVYGPHRHIVPTPSSSHTDHVFLRVAFSLSPCIARQPRGAHARGHRVLHLGQNPDPRRQQRLPLPLRRAVPPHVAESRLGRRARRAHDQRAVLHHLRHVHHRGHARGVSVHGAGAGL